LNNEREGHGCFTDGLDTVFGSFEKGRLVEILFVELFTIKKFLIQHLKCATLSDVDIYFESSF
jgi:hypothetical protein